MNLLIYEFYLSKIKIMYMVLGKHEGSHFHSCWPGRLSDGQCLLGTILPRTRNPTRRNNADRHICWRRWRLFQYFLFGNQLRKTCPTYIICRLGTQRHRYVVLLNAKNALFIDQSYFIDIRNVSKVRYVVQVMGFLAGYVIHTKNYCNIHNIIWF